MSDLLCSAAYLSLRAAMSAEPRMVEAAAHPEIVRERTHAQIRRELIELLRNEPGFRLAPRSYREADARALANE